jgi:uncharacterized damage-inducible protein DinB
MSRIQRELVRGKGAHADALACLEGVSAQAAGQRPHAAPYSIYALVWHMSFWMENELERMAGRTPPYPVHASLGWPPHEAPTDPRDWTAAVARFTRQLEDLTRLAESGPEVRGRAVPITSEAGHANQGATVEDVVWQTIVHNSHHLGQVVLLRRLIGCWPPPGGGDTW